LISNEGLVCFGRCPDHLENYCKLVLVAEGESLSLLGGVLRWG
jgi:hypothetical protein